MPISYTYNTYNTNIETNKTPYTNTPYRKNTNYRSNPIDPIDKDKDYKIPMKK